MTTALAAAGPLAETTLECAARESVSVDDRICVTRPYFALENLERDCTDQLVAGVNVETPCLNEVGPITAAEAGRHLAILGSCAAADANPANGKHYYLAHRAIFRRPSNTATDEAIGPLQAKARGSLDSKRKASAMMAMSMDRQPVCTLSVEYHVLPERMFAKLNAASRQPNQHTEANPYASPCPFTVSKLTSDSLAASLGVVRPEQCQGHFDNYPAMPVAILMSTLIRSSGQLLDEVVGRPNTKYLVREAIVEADGLGFAGEIVDLAVDYTGTCSGDFTFHGRAIASGNKSVGDLKLRLEVID